MMSTFWRFFLSNKEDKETDFDKIKVTSNGAFYMSSKDIFDDKEESLALIKSLRKSIQKYKAISEPAETDIEV